MEVVLAAVERFECSMGGKFDLEEGVGGREGCGEGR